MEKYMINSSISELFNTIENSKLYKDYKIIPFELMYGMRNVSKNAIMKGNEVVILNY